MSLTSIVAQNLRIVRTQQKLSQAAVAKKARVSVSYISMLERGERTPPLNTLEAIAKALQVSPMYLLQKLSTGRSRSQRR
ncbi:helix-turn-helix domain-containing protein [Anaeromyxobacter oryzisoli]|uniref:helix-turn-helix domain-containing protein n=1 Tax=Anaeromyxobacter oryzisoli TaxID=2925408 RepID=UPI001F5AEEC8|nr:helix-turn-helix transcriptional regulator [Anaeromyxobacter sp. SG63]